MRTEPAAVVSVARGATSASALGPSASLDSTVSPELGLPAKRAMGELAENGERESLGDAPGLAGSPPDERSAFRVVQPAPAWSTRRMTGQSAIGAAGTPVGGTGRLAVSARDLARIAALTRLFPTVRLATSPAASALAALGRAAATLTPRSEAYATPSGAAIGRDRGETLLDASQAGTPGRSAVAGAQRADTPLAPEPAHPISEIAASAPPMPLAADGAAHQPASAASAGVATTPGATPVTSYLAARVNAETASQWPVLAALSRSVSIATSTATSASRTPRLRIPLGSPAAMESLARLPALGPGEPLSLTVRRPLESVLRRDLAAIRLHVSPLAEMLGAAAFTTGTRLVFAPGRLDTRSPSGLALVGHELAHVGAELAFKRFPGAGVDDEPDERAADEQATLVQQIADRGWPSAPRMDLRRPPAADTVPSVFYQSGFAPAASAPVGAAAVQRTEAPASGAGGGGDAVPAARFGPAGPADAEPESAAPDVGALARQVYDILKGRLRAERDRHQAYGR